MVHGGVGYCSCGQEIWIEYLRDGDRWFCRFTDADNQAINRCPACGRVIAEDELESR
jgi:hypothetical protein